MVKCLNTLEKKSGITFSYNSKVLHAETKVITKDFESVLLSNVLDYIFKETAFQYQEIGGQISVYEVAATKGKVVLSGYMRDAESKEVLIGARLYFPELHIGCISNSYGYYAIEVPKGETRIIVSFVGMKSFRDTVNFQEDVVINFELQESSTLLSAVEVRHDTTVLNDVPVNLNSSEGTRITKRSIYELPGVAGELDLIKYLQQLPGVQPTEDGTANFQVRGMPAGSNLILIDEIPVYHPTHMLGVFSIVNVEAIRSATLHKDFIPLKFGGRSSAVLQIHTDEGDLSKTHFSGGLSPAGGRLNLEGPIVKQKASYYLSSRMSFFPRIAFNLLGQQQFNIPFYYDVNGKLNVQLNSNNRIYFTGYYGRDRLTDTTSRFIWGNTAGSFRWNHVMNSKTFTNLSVTHSQFNFGYSTLPWKESPLPESYGQMVLWDKVRYDVTNYFSSTLKFEFGLDASWIHTTKESSAEESINLFHDRSSIETGLYFSAEKKFGEKLILTGGLRIPSSFHFGKQDTMSYLNSDLTSTEVIYQENKPYDLIFSIDPRLMLNYKVGNKDRLNFAAGMASQHIHMVNYQYNFLSVGVWTPSNRLLKPQRNYSTSVGWVHQEKTVQFSTTVFGRYVNNILDFALPVSVVSQNIESNLLSGRLFSYGVEFQLNWEPSEKYSASIAYTYSETDQLVEGINNNESYPALFDRPHYFNFSQFFDFGLKWKLATNVIVHSGSAITVPTGQFTIGGSAFPVFPEERNGTRLPNYSRLDFVAIRALGVKKERFWGDLRLTITNLLGKSNPSSVYVHPSTIGSSSLFLSSVDYAPTTIVLSLNFKF